MKPLSVDIWDIKGPSMFIMPAKGLAWAAGAAAEVLGATCDCEEAELVADVGEFAPLVF